MQSDTTTIGFQATGFRFRRSHEKSRNGCLRCKQQRKKCDELKPSCSRCLKRMYQCQYLNSGGDGDSSDEQEATHLPIPALHGPHTSPSAVITPDSGSPFTHSTDYISAPSPSSGGPLDSISSCSTNDERLDVNSNSPSRPLDATELALLAHYLNHTSQIIPVDYNDLYALSVGVPNLAFRCHAVMSSLLALAAACKSHDIVKQAKTPLDSQSLMEIRELLMFAERHHRASLLHIQAVILNPDLYDFVLANAALMVLYASASHSVRVYLAASAKQYRLQLPSEMLPQHSQWISFTRAAHIASAAVLLDMVHTAHDVYPTATDRRSPVPDPRTEFPMAVISAPEDGPSENTRRLFLPLAASTYRRAFESLRHKAESTVTAALFQTSQSQQFTDRRLSLTLHTFLETISLLEECATAALSTTTKKDACDISDTPPNQQRINLSVDQISRVSPWVANYMISVTSIQAPHVLRRIIMSFLNKAPAEFLSLVQSVLDSSFTELGAENKMTMMNNDISQDAGSPEIEAALLLDSAHLLAMEIFAHWLVLVMLLDGVWWIGNIGQWELGQIVQLLKTRKNVLGQAPDTEETWWPESMYMIKRQLTPNFEY